MKVFYTFLICLVTFVGVNAQSDLPFAGETISFKASDGLKVTADLYMAHNNSAPFIILYHPLIRHYISASHQPFFNKKL